MNRHLISAAALASALVLAAPVAPALAAPAVAASDPVGDVKLLADTGGLTVNQRRSIDIRDVVITIRADSTRFAIRLNRITKAKSFEQMVFMTLKSKNATPSYQSDIGISAQTRDLAYAYYTPDTAGEDLVVCDPLTARVRPQRRVVLLDVPHECIPEGAVKIRLTSATGAAFRSEGTGYSRDTMKIPGQHILK